MAERGAVIEAAILAGGLGTRLRPAIDDRPKVLAPVGGRPFLAYLLDQIVAAGLERVVLCTGYLSDDVRTAFGDRYDGLALSYSREARPLGTAGALRLALPLLRSDPVLVLNGDSYRDVALADVITWHRGVENSAGTLLLTWVADSARYGSVDVDDDGTVIAFREKTGQRAPGWINAGVYVLSRRLLMSIPEQGPVSLERDVFPAWTGRGLRGYGVEAEFIDIGTPGSYARAEELLGRR